MTMPQWLVICLIYLIPIPLIMGSLLIGPTGSVSTSEIINWVSQVFNDKPTEYELVQEIVLNIRLPRIILVFLVGSALSVSGNSLQMLFKNPLVSPDILGLSAGAVFGSALSLAYGVLPLQLSAFLFGLIAVIISYYIAKTGSHISTITLILAGVIVTGIFTALLSIVQFLTDPFKLQSIVHWTMGNLHTANWQKIKISFLPIVFSISILILLRWRLNILALGDEETKSVGLNPNIQRLYIIVLTTLATSSAVAVSGMIAMVGLIVPHMVRMLAGPDNKVTQPLMVAVGGIFLLLVDNLARTVSPYEIPVSIFTTLIGAPFFVYLLKKGRIIFKDQ